ncbi:hypothetical protein ACIP25_00480 [Streptomyces massasporeus]|uniref:hypothetical protein n=1 Tax=Streptomyces massasporeus TaxID=67324 RepID=UPI00381730FE
MRSRPPADTELRDELQNAIRAAQQADEEVSAAADLVDARRAVVAQVQLDLSRLARSATAIDQLSPFEFVVCPRCMQSLAARPVEDGHDAVAPRFDAIAEASSRVAALKASIDATTRLRESWARVRAIDADIRSIKTERRQINREIKEKSEQLKAGRSLLRVPLPPWAPTRGFLSFRRDSAAPPTVM